MPGAPTRKMGRWRDGAMRYIPASSFSRYASTVSAIWRFAVAMFMPKLLFSAFACRYLRASPRDAGVENPSMSSSSTTSLIAQGGTVGTSLPGTSMKTKAVS